VTPFVKVFVFAKGQKGVFVPTLFHTLISSLAAYTDEPTEQQQEQGGKGAAAVNNKLPRRRCRACCSLAPDTRAYENIKKVNLFFCFIFLFF
jgi:hypothetical protein